MKVKVLKILLNNGVYNMMNFWIDMKNNFNLQKNLINMRIRKVKNLLHYCVPLEISKKRLGKDLI